ncbi:MAG: glycosyltransferase [Chitinophagaceae bacterium]|nr:glycosyltransferase [Chitinophagaceae bacterium]
MKKNILLLINQLHGGGAQKVIANLSISLHNDYNVTLVIYNDLDKVVFQHAGELVKVILPYSADTHNNNSFKRIYRLLSLIQKLKKIKKDRRIDVAISFMEASNIVNILSAGKEKTVLSVRSFLSNEFRDHKRLQIFRKIIKLLYNRADHIITPAKLAKLDLIKNFNVKENKITIIYNFIDKILVERNKNKTIEPHIDKLLHCHPVIINVGRITSPKAQWLLPGVLKKVQAVIPDARLLILGEGPLEEKLMEEAGNNGLKVNSADATDNTDSFDIYLTGFKENPYPYLSKSKVFIQSSVYEGFPNVIIEAMACGLPVVSSDCASGPREILNPDTDISFSTDILEHAAYGILTPVYDIGSSDTQQYINAASEAVIEILGSEEKRNHYITRSLERAHQYEKDIIMRQWISIIEEN